MKSYGGRNCRWLFICLFTNHLQIKKHMYVWMSLFTSYCAMKTNIHIISVLCSSLFYLFCLYSYSSKLYKYVYLFCSPLLLGLLCDLLKGSVSTQQQMVQGRGFVILGYLLQKVWYFNAEHTLFEMHISSTKYSTGLE